MIKRIVDISEQAYLHQQHQQLLIDMRHSSSDENAKVHIKRVKEKLPPDGEVRIVQITDKQFGKIEVFYGKKRRPIEQAPEQLSLF